MDGEQNELAVYLRPYYDVHRDIVAATNLRVAARILEPISSAVRWKDRHLKKDKRRLGQVDHLGDRYRRWTHRSSNDLAEDLAALDIDSLEIRDGVSNYINHPEIHTKYLDWLCADMLTYSEWFTTFENLQAYLVGLSGTLANSKGGAWPWVALLWRSLWSIAKWSIWLGILFLVSEMLDDPIDLILISLIVIVTVLRQYQVRMARKRINKLLNGMRATYEVLQSEVLSWDVLWQELNRTRELGAIWPGELYKLVEMKRAA